MPDGTTPTTTNTAVIWPRFDGNESPEKLLEKLREFCHEVGALVVKEKGLESSSFIDKDTLLADLSNRALKIKPPFDLEPLDNSSQNYHDALNEAFNTAFNEEADLLLAKAGLLKIGKAIVNAFNEVATLLKAFGADPVMMFNGQFTHTAQDIQIAGAGIDFVFVRSYENQAFYKGPLGFNWDHNYNLWLRVSEDKETIIRSTGALREDTFVRHPLFNYWVPPDGQDGIIIENGNSFIWQSPSGAKFFYEEDQSGLPLIHLINRIEDRFGNYLNFTYQDGQLRVVEINHPERLVEFAYNALGKIAVIKDFTGRQWCYAYDDFEDLVAVTMPGTDRYAHCLTTCYEYSSSQFTGALQHNLTRIIDAKGQLYLENQYGDSPGLLEFNRVVRQRQGGGETFFEYEDVIEEFEFDYSESERPAHQTVMIDRNGQSSRHVYNKFGNLLFKEECAMLGGLPKLLRSHYRYNRDGNLVASLSPEGVITQFLYGREYFLRRHGIENEDEITANDNLTIEERQSFTRVLASVRRAKYFTLLDLNLAREVWGDIFPDIIGGFDPDDIIVKLTYEPKYGQLLTASDSRFTKSPDPALQTEVSGEHPRYEETLSRYEYTGPTGDPTVLPAKIHRPTPTLADGTTGDPITEQFAVYDERGRLLRHIDPDGIVTENTYFGAGDGIKEGYLRRTVADAGGLAITTEVEVDDLGRVEAVHHLPRAIGAPDGHFVARTEYNELDQVVKTIFSPPFSFEIRRFYDRTGQVEREERDAKDETGADIPGAPEVRTFEYDEEFNLIKATIGGADLATHLVTKHGYTAAGQRALSILPRGNQTRYCYDERLLPVAQIAGAGTGEAATVRSQYDGDGRARRALSARGHPTTFTFDPFGRVIAAEDALGNLTRLTYDKAGNLLVERFFERRKDGTYVLLARTELEYDELGRAIRSGVNRFDDPLEIPFGENLDNAFLASPGPGEFLQMQTFYDVKSRIVKTIDPLGREAFVEYDALNRVTGTIDPLGNRVESRYDAHGNVLRVDVRDQVRHPETGDIIGERIFSRSSTYDELDRLVTGTDSLGNVTRHAYDSRGNLVRRVDPLGNVMRTEFDIFSRRVQDASEQTDTGLGGSNPLEAAINRYEYDENNNLTAVIDALGRRTAYAFDALDRRREIIYPDGSKTSFTYDADSNLIVTQDNNGLRRLMTVDPLNRTVRVEVDRTNLHPEFLVEGATFEAYAYDGLSRAIQQQNDFARCDFRFNSLGWPFEETQSFTTPEMPFTDSLRLARDFNNAGALVGLTYPGGRKIRCHRDALDRLVRVENLAKGLGYPGHSATPDVYDIAKIEYAGRHRVRCAFGNGAAKTYRHDGAGRLIEIAHQAGNNPLLTIQYLYDAIGNMRLRHDITPAGNTAEPFGYDSFYRLVEQQKAFDRPAFDPAPLAPATVLPPDPIPHRQADIDALIGLMALDPAQKTFDYDLVGNRHSEKLPEGDAIDCTVNKLDQYTSCNGTPFFYDRNGNLIRDGERTYRYDSLNRLVHVLDASTGDSIARFFHDTFGRRILELRKDAATHLLCEGVNLTAEYRNGALFAHYVHDDDVDHPLQIAAQGNEHWYHADLVGSIRNLTDRNGVDDAAYRYAPFGKLLANSTAVSYNPLLYTAHRFDDDLELYDYRTRQYDPHRGRFLQRDPKGMIDGTNLYSYAESNPLTYIDMFGTNRKEVEDKTSVVAIRIIHEKPWYQKAGSFAKGLGKAMLKAPWNVSGLGMAYNAVTGIKEAFEEGDVKKGVYSALPITSIPEGLYRGWGATKDAWEGPKEGPQKGERDYETLGEIGVPTVLSTALLAYGGYRGLRGLRSPGGPVTTPSGRAILSGISEAEIDAASSTFGRSGPMLQAEAPFPGVWRHTLNELETMPGGGLRINESGGMWIHEIRMQARGLGTGANKTTRVMVHTADPNAPAGSNSATGNTMYIRQGNWRMLPNGTWVDKTASSELWNEAHIPIHR